jgi:hypothetical protein
VLSQTHEGAFFGLRPKTGPYGNKSGKILGFWPSANFCPSWEGDNRPPIGGRIIDSTVVDFGWQVKRALRARLALHVDFLVKVDFAAGEKSAFASEVIRSF